MALRIATNLAGMTSHRHVKATDAALGEAMNHLSTGQRINAASDDAAGLGASTRLGAQASGINQAIRNSQDAMYLFQAQEGGLQNSHSLIQRMRELAVRGANDTMSVADRATINGELSQFWAEYNRTSRSEFNAKPISDVVAIQTGANAGDTMAMPTNSAVQASTATAIAQLSVTAASNDWVSSADQATRTISNLDAMLDMVSTLRGDTGARINRLKAVTSSNEVTLENIMASRGGIQDADVATEAVSMTRSQILERSGLSMLSQANSSSSTVLQLLKD